MLLLPPVAPCTGWSYQTRLARDHYVCLDANDYSVHPGVIGRCVQVSADLQRVRVSCEGKLVADHPRCWARHHSLTDPAHAEAAAALRKKRVSLARQPQGADVERRALADYDRALGLDGEVA